MDNSFKNQHTREPYDDRSDYKLRGASGYVSVKFLRNHIRISKL